jgi:hypothetical protein
MYEYSVVAGFAEYPFLSKIADPSEIRHFRVERIDLELLQHAPHPCERVYFFDKAGKLLYDLPVGWSHVGKKWYNPATWSGVSARNWDETIGVALRKLGAEADRVFYIVDQIGEHVRVSKPPKAFILKQWLEQRVEEDRRKLRENQ